MAKQEIDILNSRTYDTVVMLMAARETVCPSYLEKDIERLIEKCFDFLPEKFEIDFGSDD